MTKQSILTTLKQHRQIIPLLLLTAYCIEVGVAAIKGWADMAGETYEFALSTKHYIAFGAVTLNFLAYFLLRNLYKYILGLTVVIGLFNVIVFSVFETTQSFSLNSLKISFQPSAFLAGLLAYILNFKKVNNFILDNFRTVQTPEEQDKFEKVIFDEETQKFKERYKSYSNEDLTEIITEKRYVSGAIEAARQLLDERNLTDNRKQTNGN